MNETKEFQPQLQPVTLTAAAIEHVQKTIAKCGKGKGLRLSIKKSGCTGFGYVIDIADEPASEDYIFPINDQLAVFVDRKSYLFVQGTIIDYVRKGLNSNFEFRNPNATATCGCGESFGIEEG